MRSPLLELYRRSIFCGLNQKNPSGASGRAARGQTISARINAKERRDEDEKLSTEAGQLQTVIALVQWGAFVAQLKIQQNVLSCA
jgi:hypothetical protein